MRYDFDTLLMNIYGRDGFFGIYKVLASIACKF